MRRAAAWAVWNVPHSVTSIVRCICSSYERAKPLLDSYHFFLRTAPVLAKRMGTFVNMTALRYWLDRVEAERLASDGKIGPIGPLVRVNHQW